MDQVPLAALIHGLDADIARARAVSDYLAARALASTLSAGQPLAATADPVLVDAAAAQLGADTAEAGAHQRFDQARHAVGQVAVALYIGEQVPHAGSTINGSLPDRSEYLVGVLEATQLHARTAKAELVRAVAAATERRGQADRLVQSRTVALKAKASKSEQPSASPPRAAAQAPQSLSMLESPTILGPTLLSADELVGWFEASRHTARLTVSLPALAAAFESVGAAAGVRPDLAFAQSILETGYFSFPAYGQVTMADNNFAGIGACDQCATGFHFPDASTGVAAQMQLLHAYAATKPLVSGPLPGPFRVSGCCRTWMELTGVWATAPDYGVKILSLYRSMVRWGLARRTAAARL